MARRTRNRLPCDKKLFYPNEESARLATVGMPRQAYECAHCGLWHVERFTAKPLHTERDAKSGRYAKT